jgi:hypothetical protein
MSGGTKDILLVKLSLFDGVVTETSTVNEIPIMPK